MWHSRCNLLVDFANRENDFTWRSLCDEGRRPFLIVQHVSTYTVLMGILAISHKTQLAAVIIHSAAVLFHMHIFTTPVLTNEQLAVKSQFFIHNTWVRRMRVRVGDQHVTITIRFQLQQLNFDFYAVPIFSATNKYCCFAAPN